jgi:PTS system mannose-specific IID component
MLPAVGIGLLLRSIGRPRLMPYYVIGFVLAAYLELPILVIAVLGAAVAWLALGRARGDQPARQRVQQAPETRAAPVPRRVLWGAWLRWFFFLHACYNYERLQGLGFAHAMKPVIEHLYSSMADRAAVLRRHLVLFNTEPQFGALVPAAVIAMEQERASGADLSEEAIYGVKSGLMGPLAGVGDSLIQGLVTPLLLSVGISLALQGNLAGPVLYAIVISVIIMGTSAAFWGLGYRWGRAAVSRVLASGWVQAVTDMASVTGLAVLGGLTATVVRVPTPASIAVGEMVVSLQVDVLDAILLNLLPLALTLGVWGLLQRRVPSTGVIGGLFVLGMVLTYLGLLGQSAPPLFSERWIDFVVGGRPVTAASLLTHLWPLLLAVGVAGIVLLVRRLFHK